ncbi:YibE/F family protein [Leifsonia shinshuensis]|uniref:Putative membrane protein n=1 Tax=Leifsonia shinshuensis TaxID=150026 RepID=A0A853CVU5_9MICO|nr:YibE/F family protein [Leifsonia shinshuensis]NYJ23314.1 putative membrane protein [Leifsonia shinshuensis]
MAHAHSHSHGRGDRTPKAGRTLRAVVAGVLIAAALATAAGLALLWPDHAKVATASSKIEFAPKGTTFPTGKIVALQNGCPGYFSSGAATTAPGDTRACQLAGVQLLDGKNQGRTVTIPVLWPYASAGLHVGDRLELVLPPQSTPGGTQGLTVNGVIRDQALWAWAIVFAIVVVAVGLLRGLMALVSLAFSGFMLVAFVLPALVSGQPGLPVAVVGGSAIMFVVLYLAHGPSVRTSVALLGTLFGIVLTAGIAQLAVTTTHLTGVTGDVGGMLAGTTQIDFRGVLTCAIVIAGLGVLNDVTVTQASSVWELRAASPALTRRQLFARAMRIGRDHIASTIYTIAFAYAGAAMVVLIVLYLYDRSTLSLLSQEDLAAEVVRTLCSGIGLVLAVPVTTAIAAALVPAEVVGAEENRLLDALKLRWYSFVPRAAAVEEPSRPY